MTFREKLADWISGGDYSRHKENAEVNRKALVRNITAKQVYYSALAYIVQQDTPYSNSTVKRMVAKANEAMEHAGSI